MSRGARRRQPLVSTVVTLRAPLDRGVLADVQRLLHAQEHVVVVLATCDLAVVDAVARMVLCARRYGGELDVIGDRDLLRACGLDDL